MRTTTLPAALALLASSILGCQGSSGTSTCAANTVELTGTLEGATVSGQYTAPSSYSFMNVLEGKPGSVTFGFGTGERLALTFYELVLDDASTAASGSLTMPTGGALGGQTFCVSAATVTPRSTNEGGGVSFELSTLVNGPCARVSVAGTLEGCVSPAM
jgi:hypothetical protein